jgi:hypothetical protein
MLGQRIKGGLREDEWGRQVHGERCIPRVDSLVRKRDCVTLNVARARICSVVNEDVDLAELVERPFNDRTAVICRREIDGEAGRFNAKTGRDLLGARIASSGLPVDDDDPGAKLGQGLGACEANMTCAAGDDGNAGIEG